MRWVNKILWWLITISLCSDGKILNILILQNRLPAWNRLNELMNLCFSERTNPIVITKDLVDAIYGTRRDVDYSNLNVIDHNFEARQIQIFNPAYPTYILSANSTDQLKHLLYALKSSPIWSLDSVFFIVETNKETCANASKMLQVLWKLNLISAFYICYENDTKEIMMLYTYNPFTDRAPEPWVEVESVNEPGDRWTLFRQPYTYDKGICGSLLYDKTKSLDGHNVKLVSSSAANYIRNKNYTIESLRNHSESSFQIALFENLFTALNVTPVVNYDEPGLWVNGTALGSLKLLKNSTYDISTDLRPLQYIEYVDYANMHFQRFYLILTQRKNLVKTSGNYENYLNYKVIGASVLILLVTFVIIVMNNGADYGNGMLDVIRLSISAGIDAPLDKLSVRIIFFLTTTFIFIMSPEIQGEIFSYSTKPERYYPQNLEDLRDFKFNVHYLFVVEGYISDKELWLGSDRKYLHSFKYFPPYCYKLVLNDSSNACIAPVEFQLHPAEKYNLHLARKELNHYYMSFWTRKNWVLKKKVDEVVTRFRETGLLNKWEKLDTRNIREKIKINEASELTAAEYDEIDFENLIPVYLFIILGFSLGVLIFVAEVVIAKRKEAWRRKKNNTCARKKIARIGIRRILIQ